MKFSMETSAKFQQMPKFTDNIFKAIQFVADVEVLLCMLPEQFFEFPAEFIIPCFQIRHSDFCVLTWTSCQQSK